jgi:uncharacterized protein YndB with AHSA1/START domain
MSRMNRDTTLHIERVIDAPREAVFAAWPTAAAMEEWYRDGDDHVVEVLELDVRVGGGYRIDWGPAGARPHRERGVYEVVEPPSRLVMTETLDTADGGGWENTRLTVEFEDQNGKTLLKLTHENFPSTDHRDGASGGWPGFLDRIEQLVTAR